MHRLAHTRTLLWSLLAFAPLIALVGWAAEAGSREGGAICFGKEATLAYPDTQFVDGTPGADVIVTGAQGQLIDARGGDDRVCAGGRDDVVKGGPGNDKVDGENGDDNMRGGPGNDRLKGGDVQLLLRTIPFVLRGNGV
jgi:hypothetical protein